MIIETKGVDFEGDGMPLHSKKMSATIIEDLKFVFDIVEDLNLTRISKI